MRKILFFLFIFTVVFGNAQQLPQYTQWSLHQFSLNPAHAGIKKCVDFHTLYRAQWYGLEGAPQSGFITAAIPINTRRKKFFSARHGTGVKFERDQIGQFQTHRFNVAYAAHFNFSVDNRLSLGIYGGFLQFAYDHSNSISIEPDPRIMQEASFIAPDATFGAWWNGKDYYLGAIFQNLIPYKWQELGDDSRFRFHANFNGGYRFAASDKFTIIPAFIVRIPPRNPISLDLNTLFDFSNKFAFGIGYRNTDALITMVQLKIKQQLTINYSFDFVLSELRPGTVNTHEISLSFSGCKNQNTNSTRCPLFD